MKRLQQLLEAYREGGTFPTYTQLAEIAYGNQLHIPAPVQLPNLKGDQNAPQTKPN